MVRFFLKIVAFSLVIVGIFLFVPFLKFCTYKTQQKEYLPRYIKDMTILEDQSLVEVYSSEVKGWQGYFSVHSWIAIKRAGEKDFTIYEIISERVKQGLSSLTFWKGNPDRLWEGNPPKRVLRIQDKFAEKAIPLIEKAVFNYPFQNIYEAWPGPNCNTFLAYLGREVPLLRLHLPSNAIGKGYLPFGRFFALAPSGTGVQFSLGGFFGITLAAIEGIELSIFGLQLTIKTILFPRIPLEK